MNWLEHKIYLYNVTMGLYMLDWWERSIFNTLLIFLMLSFITRMMGFSFNISLFAKVFFVSLSLGYACPYSSVNGTASMGSPTGTTSVVPAVPPLQ